MQIDRDKIIKDKNRKKIEKYLAIRRKASINQISRDLKIPLTSTGKSLDYLESIGRVYKSTLGNSTIYYFEKNGDW